MSRVFAYAIMYALGLAAVAWLSPWVGAPAGQVASYVAQAALLGLVFGAVLGSSLAGHGRAAWILGGGWVFLALAYGVGQGGLALAAANGLCWGVGLLLLLAIGGGLAGRQRSAG